MSQLELNTGISAEKKTFFADVILPVPIPKMFTYRVPFKLNEVCKVGARVVVQFGSRKILTGVIGKIHQKPPEKYEARYILELLDETPSVNDFQLKFYKWIANYYMCTMGEVINVALPSGLKLTSESKIQLNPSFSYEESSFEFSENELTVLEELETNKSLTYNQVRDITGVKNIHSLIKSMVQKDAIIIFEQVKEKYKPKISRKIRLNSEYVSEKAVKELFDGLEKKPKQLDVLMRFLQKIPVTEKPELNNQGLSKSILTDDKTLSDSSVKTLIKNKIFEEFEVIVPRFEEYKGDMESFELTREQKYTRDNILDHFQSRNIVLLHGITGSGKTEIYIELIKEVLESGYQVVYLLPEIALTTQIVTRLRKIFGDKMGVYHSRFSDNERVEVWEGVSDGRFSFIVGVRSTIFLPFDNLGLIIVDEEHETSYKQHDPAPRYHARDAAIVLAEFHNAKILLGSATPSMESFFNARTNKYALVTLAERYGKSILPEFIIADTLKERKKKTMHGEFTSLLIENLQQVIDQKEQAIIFQNRRGYAPYVTCLDCAWIPKCEHCSVSLVYHMYKNELQCHYCGFKERMPNSCHACGSDRLKTISYGTEKLEEDLKLLLPDARIQRMDLDTTRRKLSYNRIIKEFEDGGIDILVGTQMVSKGLDFDKVSLVGIFDIDRMMHFPDFRSHERTFHLATQVSGRAGRRNKDGIVIIQSSQPGNRLIQKIINHDYQGFYEFELNERKRFHYPPYSRLIKLIIKDTDKEVCDVASRKLYKSLANQLNKKRVLGPQEPVISKIRNKYLMEIYIKLEREKVNLKRVKEIIEEKTRELLREKEFKQIQVIFDVDPY